MGRPPCCDKVGIKKGPWTPEEDIILASYIQEHGPGNWRSVPTNTGLLRCSKSCRLRWTNYLRPGIKRGNFTPHEERMIIHLQALLGNKWAAIASYLPQRTDNDIKNYWNTHLKKKIKKFQSVLHPHLSSSSSSSSTSSSSFQLFNKNYSTSTEKRSSLLTDMTHHHHHQISTISKSNQTSSSTTNTTITTTTSTYASSTENISRLLEGWMKSPPKTGTSTTTNTVKKPITHEEKLISAKVEEQSCDDHLISHEEFESLLSFDENISNIAWDQNKSSSSPSADDSTFDQESHDDDDKNTTTTTTTTTTTHIDQKLETMSSEGDQQHDDHNQGMENQPPFSLLEKWLLDEATAGQVLQEMELSPMF